jgi:hypothetical protein
MKYRNQRTVHAQRKSPVRLPPASVTVDAARLRAEESSSAVAAKTRNRTLYAKVCRLRWKTMHFDAGGSSAAAAPEVDGHVAPEARTQERADISSMVLVCAW